MALLYTDIAAVQAGNVNILANLQDTNLTAGRVKQITAIYTMTGNEAAGDIINIARANSGSLVNPVTGNMAAEAIAATATVSVGDTDTKAGTIAADAVKYSAAVDIHAGNTTVGFPFTGGTTLLSPAEIVDDWVFLTATFATLVTPVAGKKIVFRIASSMLD